MVSIKVDPLTSFSVLPFLCQIYTGVNPPLVLTAINVMLPAPGHTFVAALEMLIVGVTVDSTLTCTVSEPAQPEESVPITVYVVVTLALHVTFKPVVLFNPSDGDQVYVVPLMLEAAIKVVVSPLQMVCLMALKFMVGKGNIEICKLSVLVHPLVSVIVTEMVLLIVKLDKV